MADTLKSPCPRVQGAALARPFVQRLRTADGSGAQILALVREAELTLENLHALSEIYSVAWDIYGKAGDVSDNDLSDLSVKCMRMLCRVNPNEAREFHNRQRTYRTGGQADARMYEARASMEERLGDKAKAIKMLQEGLKVGAQPEEALRRQLKKLQPPEAPSLGASSSAARAPAATTGSGIGQQAQVSKPTSTISHSADTPGKSSTSRFQGLACKSPARPLRVLGLGPAERVLPGEGGGSDSENDVDGNNDQQHQSTYEKADLAAPSVELDETRDEAVVGGDNSEEDKLQSLQESRLSTTIQSSMALTPIKELDSAEEATADSACRTSGTPAARRQPSLAGSTAPREAMNASTPLTAKRDVSIHSDAAFATPVAEEKSEPTPSCSSRKAKSIVVNGVPYAQVRTIGRGGSSKVYLVQSPSGDSLALKRVTTDSVKQFEAFMNEVDLLMRLRGQQYVIQVLDAEIDKDNGRIHIVMEAGDVDLGRFLQSEQRLSLAKVQRIWRQMLEAVQVIHNARIVHSDLKPGNFVLVDGHLKVIDFGIAKGISNDTTNISRDASVGTLSYMAPEAVTQGQLKLGRSSDIWSLGIILYQMVYGQPPFAHLDPMQRLFLLNNPDMTITFHEGHCLEQHSDATKAQLRDVLERCLQRDPRRRPSLDDLLKHPFLSSEIEVKREVIELALTNVMSQVSGLLGDAMQVIEPSSSLKTSEWQALADEVWEQISNPDSLKKATEFKSLAQFAVINARFGSLQRERDAAIAEKQKLQEELNALTSQNALPTDRSLQPRSQGVSTGELNGLQPSKVPKSQQKLGTDTIPISDKENWNSSIEKGALRSL